jgi:DNA helicase-2/ATP-dependent DNA helicase PcrA
VSEHRFSAGLNSQQQQAVEHGTGPLLILAGAGTGKTRVITQRIASLLDRGLASEPREILALTFTNKAAQEMRERTEALCGPSVRKATISTFHSACARWLRRYGRHAKLTASFSIYDDDDQIALIRTIAERLALPHDASAARSYRQRIDQTHNQALRVHEVHTAARGREGEVFAELYENYQAELRRNNATDFGDMLASVVHMLQDDEQLKASFRAMYPWVLVDEFQDTNVAQYQLLQELCPPDGNLCAVGDDDQSIYRWRGASVENLQSFQDDFVCTTIALVQNYRSTSPILDAAHEVVHRLPSRMEKRLVTDRTDGQPVQVYIASDDREECEFIARAIARTRAEKHLSWSDFAVFYRTNAQSRGFEERLRAAQVPHRVIGSTSFFDRREIKDIVAYLRLIANPSDDVAMRRVINTPPRGIGASTLHIIDLHAAHRGGSGLVDALIDIGSAPPPRTPKRTRAALKTAAELFSRLRTLQNHARADEIIEAVLEESGYETWVRESDPDAGEDRLANLDELRNSAKEYGDREPQGTLSGFLEHVALAADQVIADDDDPSFVSLMTVHAAKGLEFPVVFVSGLEEETFPLNRKGMATEAELDEERRLCYVALTRARDQLVLSASMRRQVHGQIKWMQPSRFLIELGDERLVMLPDSASNRVNWRDRGGAATSSGGPADRTSARGPTFDEFDQRPWQERMASVPETGIVFDDSHFPEESVANARGYVGRRAQHRLFGIGNITDADPAGEHIRLTIDFPDVGTKKVVLKYVELLD